MNEIFQKSRVDRKCTLCYGIIKKGQYYKNIVLTPWDNAMNDGFFTIHAHPDCWEAYLAYSDYETPVPNHPSDFEEMLGHDREIYPLNLSISLDLRILTKKQGE